jgi:hypothetical protein
MTLTYWTDVHLMTDLPDTAIASALAAALRVSPQRVAVASSGSPQVSDAALRPELAALVQREDIRWDAPDTRWPFELRVALNERTPAHPEMILVALAEALGVPILTDFASDDQDTFRVILPTGEALARFADDDADIVYEPGDAERLAPYLPKDAFPLAS